MSKGNRPRFFVIVSGRRAHYLIMYGARLLVPAALLVFSLPAQASGTGRLAYQAAQGCPSEPEFVASVATRGGDFDAPEATGGHHLMVVSIRRQEDGFAGAFQVRGEQLETNTREVHGPTCAEVAEALAVVTAIALHDQTIEPPGSRAPSATPAATPENPKPAAGSLPSLADDRLRGSTRAFPPRTETLEVPAGTLRLDLRRSATFSVGATAGLVPMLLPRYELSFVAANFLTTPAGAQRISGLVLKLRIGALGEGTYRSTTTASGLSFGMDLCQSPLYDTRGLVLLFCGGYGGGVMFLKTKDASGVQTASKNAGFGEVTFSAEAQYQFAGGFHAGLRVGGGLTVGDVTVDGPDGRPVFGPSLWSASVLAGVGFRF